MENPEDVAQTQCTFPDRCFQQQFSIKSKRIEAIFENMYVCFFYQTLQTI